jgi:hypothetical protein
MRRRGESGAIATLIYDGGDAYEDSFYDENWLGQGEEPRPGVTHRDDRAVPRYRHVDHAVTVG